MPKAGPVIIRISSFKSKAVHLCCCPRKGKEKRKKERETNINKNEDWSRFCNLTNLDVDC